MLVTTVISSHEYLVSSYYTIVMAYKNHKFEFQRHACRMILLTLAIVFALGYATTGFYAFSVFTLCIEINKNGLMMDPESGM